MSEATKGSPSSNIGLVLGSEITTSYPRARQKVVQKGMLSQNSRHRGRPTVRFFFLLTSEYLYFFMRSASRIRKRSGTFLISGALSSRDSPRGHLLPVIYAVLLGNFTTVRLQWFAQKGQILLSSCSYVNPLSFSNPMNFVLLGAWFFVRRATPMAPISPGNGARFTFTLRYCSRARRTASFLKVPPWTMMFFPRLEVSEILTTFVKTFSMIERQRPAMMSSALRPFFCSVIMVLFMNTVHRLPRFAGCRLAKAASAIFSRGMFSDVAKFCRNDPQPEEQASFNVMFVTISSFIQMPFMS